MSARALRAAKREALRDEHENEQEVPTKKCKTEPASPCPSLSDDLSSVTGREFPSYPSYDDDDEVTELEKERMAIVMANKAYLEQLGLQNDKAQLYQSVKAMMPKKEPKKPKPMLKSSQHADQPVRRSERLSGVKPAGFYVRSETARAIHFAGPGKSIATAEEIVKESGPSCVVPEVLTLDSTSTTDKHGVDFLESLKALSSEALDVPAISRPVMNFAEKVSRLDIDRGQTVAKVVPARIYSCVFHPSATKVLAVAGDKEGNIGFWDVNARDDDSSVFVYHPHTSVVSALQYMPGDHSKLWSWSYDGNVRCMDAVKQEFRQMFIIDEDVHGWLQHGCISEGDPNTMYASTSHGLAMCIDVRQCGPGHRTAQWKLQAHHKKCNTVHPCPSDPNLLATAALDGSIKVWDVRKVSNSSKTTLASFQYKRSVNSAFFNATGSHLLAVTQNDTICIFPEASWAAGKVKNDAHPTILKHDNQTGRWLSTLHGVWNPREPHAFLIGSMQHPRCLEVYSTDGGGRRIGVLRGECLTSVCSRNCWHPNLDMVCGGNASGRLHIFR